MKIDFYVLETTSALQSRIFACRLVEQFYQEQGSGIFLHTDSKEEAEKLDALLWTFGDTSFLPHQLYSGQENQAPIQIGFGESPLNKQTILINFGKEIPGFYQQCDQVIEIVFTDPVVQQCGRQKYKQYRDQGHDIQTIKSKIT